MSIDPRDTSPARQMPDLPPISGYHLAESVQAGQSGASDAVSNHPPPHSSMLSQTELALLGKVRDMQVALRQEVGAKLNAVHAAVLGARERFTESRYATRVKSIEAAMRAALTRHGSELEQKVYDALRAKREYEYFNYVHKRMSDPKLDKWQFILAFLVVPLAIESLLNGNFFAEASDFGLVGGAATAVIISALNISLGFIMGLGPVRYCQHVKASHLFWALPASVGIALVIVLFNLAVGHYREMLIANPDATSIQVVPRMQANLLAIYDLKSIALVIIGCLVAFVSASKGYAAFGHYPGHASAYKSWRQRWSAVETERRRIDVDLLPELEQLRGQVEDFRSDCRAEIGQLRIAKTQADEARDIYFTRLQQLRDAKDAALMQYRDANLKVRTDLPPAYFSQGVTLPEIDQPPELESYGALVALLADFERQLANMPALIEAKLKDQLALIRGVDLAGEIERLKARAAEAGRDAFEQDEAARKTIAAEFVATAR
ncbi:hypothetical protein [Bosea sp. PAMC 26642]|uniref:hypothetical protein n=1 Tax=Bosea sp. (strain PAMC 26642) TaxID=1792307 RepID=UPI0007701727|nr:hypothetical protein [Bosea sp. PAMC 26642]AMJ59308.1 hypothetical protein AXW83_02425 [Bosea sp. PAMC 26642]